MGVHHLYIRHNEHVRRETSTYTYQGSVRSKGHLVNTPYTYPWKSPGCPLCTYMATLGTAGRSTGCCSCTMTQLLSPSCYSCPFPSTIHNARLRPSPPFGGSWVCPLAGLTLALGRADAPSPPDPAARPACASYRVARCGGPPRSRAAPRPCRSERNSLSRSTFVYMCSGYIDF